MKTEAQILAVRKLAVRRSNQLLLALFNLRSRKYVGGTAVSNYAVQELRTRFCVAQGMVQALDIVLSDKEFTEEDERFLYSEAG